MGKKEKNEQRRKMAVAIFQAMTPEKQLELVEENKKKHAEKWANWKIQQEHKRAMLKAGREFVRKNSVMMFYGQLGEYGLSAGAMMKTIRATEGNSEQIVYRVAYSFRSPRDKQNTRMACGYVGWRLLEEHRHNYTFTVNMSRSGAIIPERLAQIIRIHVEMDIVSKRVHVTPRLHRFVLEGQRGTYLEPAPGIPKTPKKVLRKATEVSA